MLVIYSIHSNINGYDRSILSDIDPDIHYNNCVDAQYYNENSFNKVFRNSNELSLMHLNIKSVPAHFSQLRAQLDLLSVNLKLLLFVKQQSMIVIHVIIFQAIH